VIWFAVLFRARDEIEAAQRGTPPAE